MPFRKERDEGIRGWLLSCDDCSFWTSIPDKFLRDGVNRIELDKLLAEHEASHVEAKLSLSQEELLFGVQPQPKLKKGNLLFKKDASRAVKEAVAILHLAWPVAQHERRGCHCQSCQTKFLTSLHSFIDEYEKGEQDDLLYKAHRS